MLYQQDSLFLRQAFSRLVKNYTNTSVLAYNHVVLDLRTYATLRTLMLCGMHYQDILLMDFAPIFLHSMLLMIFSPLSGISIETLARLESNPNL